MGKQDKANSRDVVPQAEHKSPLSSPKSRKNEKNVFLRPPPPVPAVQKWRRHFDVARELDLLSASHLRSLDIREEMGEARRLLQDLAVCIHAHVHVRMHSCPRGVGRGVQVSVESRGPHYPSRDDTHRYIQMQTYIQVDIEHERSENRTQRASIRAVDECKRALAGSPLSARPDPFNYNDKTKKSAMGSNEGNGGMRVVSGLSMSALRRSARALQLSVMSPRLQQKAQQLNKNEKQALLEEEEERRGHLALLMWTRVVHRLFYFQLNEHTASLRQAAERYNKGDSFSSSEDENDDTEPRERSRRNKSRRAARLQFILLGEEAEGDKSVEGPGQSTDWQVQVMSDGTRLMKPAEPQPLSQDLIDSIVKPLTPVTSHDAVGGHGLQRAPAGDDDNVSGAEESDRRVRRVQWTGDAGDGGGATAEERGGGQGKKVKRITGGKPAPFVEREREEWKRRVREREAAREAARAARRQEEGALPSTGAKGQAYVEAAKAVQKKYNLIQGPQGDTAGARGGGGGGGLLLPGGALLRPLRKRAETRDEPRAETRDEAGSLTQSGVAVATAKTAHSSSRRGGYSTQSVRSSAQSAYSTTFVEASDVSRSVVTVYPAGKPKVKASVVVPPPQRPVGRAEEVQKGLQEPDTRGKQEDGRVGIEVDGMSGGRGDAEMEEVNTEGGKEVEAPGQGGGLVASEEAEEIVEECVEAGEVGEGGGQGAS